MKVQWWGCMLGLFCMPAEVILIIWTASQNPASTSYKRVNSSAEITCSTSLSDPMGVYLHRRFHSNKDIVYLSLKGGLITKNTINEDFAGRIVVTPDQQIKGGYGFTMQLSLLELEDTNLYYCSWTYFELSKKQTVSSNGTVIIVSETGPKEQCREPIWDFTLILLSITAFIVVLSLFIAALIWRCRRFKKHFRPGRAAEPPAPDRPQHVCPQQHVQLSPYLITSSSHSDFRGIL
ncbi:uncharacterized protein LOC103374823 [Stegastes partitus]|uniref:Uncharacterized protein LOC103374823 n=1 Tax=Stegastes partitus TaxID=144197 RepID=A0A9Y4NTH7_9TELE|nr:PREDICTED: uncharacterized protein LOC103374823 [Stegastes partitus]